MMRKPKGTLDQIFKDATSKPSPHEINWLLDVGQTDLRGLSREKQVDFLYKKIYSGLGRQKKVRSTPVDVALDFYLEPMAVGLIKFKSYMPEISSPKDRELNEKKVIEFLMGLSGFVIKLKAARNKSESNDSLQIPRTSFSAAPYLDFDGDIIKVIYDWKSYKGFGPFVLSDLLKGSPIKALKFCPHCKRIFFSTHHKKLYCSDSCKKAEKSIKSDKEKILDRLKSRRAYLANSCGTEDNSEIAQRLEEDGFIEEMRESGFFDPAEIKRLVPDSGKYGRRTKGGENHGD
jgi:hypothetical protein